MVEHLREGRAAEQSAGVAKEREEDGPPAQVLEAHRAAVAHRQAQLGRGVSSRQWHGGSIPNEARTRLRGGREWRPPTYGSRSTGRSTRTPLNRACCSSTTCVTSSG